MLYQENDFVNSNMTLSIALTLSIFFSVSVSSVWGSIKVNIESKQFVDEKKRSKIFHGVNAVYKVPPYYPQTEGFDVNNSLSEIDSKNLRSWGFNVVRLGVMWPGKRIVVDVVHKIV